MTKLLSLLVTVAFVSHTGAQICYEADTGYLECENINASSVGLLQHSLRDMAATYNQFVVDLYASDLTGFPVDIFVDYNIVTLFLSQCWSSDVFPHDLLAGISYSLTWLSLYNGTVGSLTAADMDLPLKGSVTDIRIQMCDVQSIEPMSFSGYVSATDLLLNLNSVNHLSADTFTGMTSLQFLEIDGSNVTTVDVGGFGQLPALTSLSLQYNNFTFLQEGVFNGLPSNFSLSLTGNNFNCTCELQWLKDWINRTMQIQSCQAYCAYPTPGYFPDIDFCG